MLPHDSVKKGEIQKAKVLWMTGKNLGRTHIVATRDLTKVEK